MLTGMGALNVRIDPAIAAFLERVARETGRSKSAIVREALQQLREIKAAQKPRRPADAMAHLIGSWDSGGQRLSERTGARFAKLLRERQDDHGTRRRRTARRAD